MNDVPIYPQTQDRDPGQLSVGQKIMNTTSAGTAQPVIGALPGVDGTNQRAIANIVGTMANSARPWLENQLQQEGQVNQKTHTPLDAADPRYRMGIGQRILGSLVNFANGFSGGKLPNVHVGPGAVNRRYYQDEQQREDEAAASDERLNSLKSAREQQDQLHDQLTNFSGNQTTTIQPQEQAAAATTDQTAQAWQQSPARKYEDYVRQAAQEGDPEKAAEWNRGLRMAERIQQGRERGTIMPPPTATDGLTPDEQKRYQDAAYGVNMRIEALEKAERTPEIDAYLKNLYQQRDAVANDIRSRRSGSATQKIQGRWNARTGRFE
jgi:hypothetical protein